MVRYILRDVHTDGAACCPSADKSSTGLDLIPQRTDTGGLSLMVGHLDRKKEPLLTVENHGGKAVVYVWPAVFQLWGIGQEAGSVRPLPTCVSLQGQPDECVSLDEPVPGDSP